MFSIIIATHDSERTLVPTLAALVPGATAGIVREVIVADGGSRDHTEAVADMAGCAFVSASGEPLGARLKRAAASARGNWLMFLQPGVVPGPAWIDETSAFAERVDLGGNPRAGVFADGAPALGAILRRAFLPSPRRGLIISRSFYNALGAHPANAASEAALLRRIGRRRIVTLRTEVTFPDI